MMQTTRHKYFGQMYITDLIERWFKLTDNVNLTIRKKLHMAFQNTLYMRQNLAIPTRNSLWDLQCVMHAAVDYIFNYNLNTN
jgi:hypothetical protein